MKISAWQKQTVKSIAKIPDDFMKATLERFFKHETQPPYETYEAYLFLIELRSRLPKPDYNAFITHLEGLGETR